MRLNTKCVPSLLLLCNCVFAAQTDIKLSDFEWLTGKWKYTNNSNSYHEFWSLMDNKLIAEVFSVNGTDTVSREQFRIELLNNVWTFTAATETNQISQFFPQQAKSDPNTWTFEKKGNDFPKRINYRRQASDILVVWIEGDLNGHPMKFEYPMKRLD